jgi:hypothetical protein
MSIIAKRTIKAARISIRLKCIFKKVFAKIIKFHLNPTPKAVNLSLRVKDKLDKKVSPPFEGGVVGMIDYHIYTVFYLPTGVVDLR